MSEAAHVDKAASCSLAPIQGSKSCACERLAMLGFAAEGPLDSRCRCCAGTCSGSQHDVSETFRPDAMGCASGVDCLADQTRWRCRLRADMDSDMPRDVHSQCQVSNACANFTVLTAQQFAFADPANLLRCPTFVHFRTTCSEQLSIQREPLFPCMKYNSSTTDSSDLGF